MATAPGGSSVQRQPDPELGGWVVFAAVLLFISGTFGSVWGLAAILNHEAVTVGGRGVLILDFTTWGWAHLIVGVIMLATAAGLFGMAGWARWTAVFFATLQAVLEVGSFTAFPLWSVVVITLDVVIIYQLTVRWQTV